MKAPLEAVKATGKGVKKVAPKSISYTSPGLSVTPKGYPRPTFKKSLAPNKPK